MAGTKFVLGGGGGDTLRSEALLKVRNFNHWPVAEILFDFCSCELLKSAAVKRTSVSSVTLKSRDWCSVSCGKKKSYSEIKVTKQSY